LLVCRTVRRMQRGEMHDRINTIEKRSPIGDARDVGNVCRCRGSCKSGPTTSCSPARLAATVAPTFGPDEPVKSIFMAPRKRVKLYIASAFPDKNAPKYPPIGDF